MKSILFFVILTISLKAHFLTILPQTDSISNMKDSNIVVEAMFMHPFEQTGMKLEKPVGIFLENKNNSLKLNKINKFNNQAWSAEYKVKRPGVYKFFIEPKPYFEKSEEKYIKHVSKVIVSAFGREDGWDEPIGLKYEIIPLVKPFALYAGNIFQGKVLKDGKALKNVEVEVELYNEFNLKAPTDAHITQSVKTDGNGIFSFVMNHKGWWGFAALVDEGTKKFDGKEYPIENGALLWIKAY